MAHREAAKVAAVKMWREPVRGDEVGKGPRDRDEVGAVAVAGSERVPGACAEPWRRPRARSGGQGGEFGAARVIVREEEAELEAEGLQADAIEAVAEGFVFEGGAATGFRSPDGLVDGEAPLVVFGSPPRR